MPAGSFVNFGSGLKKFIKWCYNGFEEIYEISDLLINLNLYYESHHSKRNGGVGKGWRH